MPVPPIPFTITAMVVTILSIAVSKSKALSAGLRSSAVFLALTTIYTRAEGPSPILFSLEKPSITQAEPVLLHINVRNMESQPLVVDFGLNAESNILISVTDPAGNQHEKPQANLNEGPQSFGWERLEQGQQYSNTLILNEWFEFNQIGNYKITIRLKKPPTLGTQPIQAEISPLVLELKPYDRPHLVSVCNELATQIRQDKTNDSYLNSRLAARALGYVRDPVAIPYWDQVLAHVPDIAIPSLRKIGTVDAVRVLARALDLHNKEAQAQARFALQTIAQQTSDASVKAEAQLALKHH